MITSRVPQVLTPHAAEAHRFRRNLDNTILKWKQVGAVRDVAEINRLYRAMEEDMEI